MADNKNILKIDDKEYNFDDLSEKAKNNLISLRTVDRRIADARQDLAILQTARNAYAKALSEILAEDGQ
jgi:hypothetical protein